MILSGLHDCTFVCLCKENSYPVLVVAQVVGFHRSFKSWSWRLDHELLSPVKMPPSVHVNYYRFRLPTSSSILGWQVDIWLSTWPLLAWPPTPGKWRIVWVAWLFQLFAVVTIVNLWILDYLASNFSNSVVMYIYPVGWRTIWLLTSRCFPPSLMHPPGSIQISEKKSIGTECFAFT